ncbi:MAG TPA: hypothetical protein VGK67_02560 [Myxococcales bacterium]|jgi:VIT1/CCC1 family predicted Fe2+/Mn2+ transporter
MADLSRLSYGSTAAIVTSMGLIAGLAGTAASRVAVVASLLVIALADNLTDSLAIHVYQESEKLDTRQAFRATVANFFSRLLVGGSFVAAVLVLPVRLIVPVGLGWGLLLLAGLTWLVARSRGASPLVEVAKHLGVAAAVIAVSKAVGLLILTYLT